MANLSLNQNQTFQSPVLGMVTGDPQPQTLSCQLDPNSAWTGPITAGQTVKLTTTASSQIMVDPCTAATDKVFGVIAYNLRKNSYSLGDVVEVVGRGGIIMLESSGAIARGDGVATTNQTVGTNDPTIATDTTATHYVTGFAMEPAAGAGVLIKVLVAPGLNNAAGAGAAAAVVNNGP